MKETRFTEDKKIFKLPKLADDRVDMKKNLQRYEKTHNQNRLGCCSTTVIMSCKIRQFPAFLQYCKLYCCVFILEG
jgi:hypothetical protein